MTPDIFPWPVCAAVPSHTYTCEPVRMCVGESEENRRAIDVFR